MRFLLYHEVGFKECVRDIVHNLPCLLLLKLLYIDFVASYRYLKQF